MRIIDTHLHIWNKEEFSLPVAGWRREVLNRTYSLEDYKTHWSRTRANEVEGGCIC